MRNILTMTICIFFVLYVNYYNKNYDVYKAEKHVWENEDAVDKDGNKIKKMPAACSIL